MGKRARKARGRGGHPGRVDGPPAPARNAHDLQRVSSEQYQGGRDALASELSIYCGGLARADPDASTSIEIVNIDV